MWFISVLFFAFQFVLRLWPSLIIGEMQCQLGIDAAGIGLLSSVYYYGYAGMQIPTAILLDKYGPRYIISLFALLAGGAMFVFTYTENFYVACFCRFLIGAASAVGFLGVAKTISDWFSKEQFAKMIGYSFSLGLLGAIYGGKPVSLLIEKYQFYPVSIAFSIASVTIGLAAYLLIRSPKKSRGNREDDFAFSDMKCILKMPSIWILAISNLLMVGALEGFADVWGVPYLMVVQGYNKPAAAELVSFIFIGLIVGGPLLAKLSTFLGNYATIFLAGLCLCLSFFLLLFGMLNSWIALVFLFFIIGIMCCYQVIVFAAGAQLVGASLLSITIAFLNCINMLGGSFFHSFIGCTMDIIKNGSGKTHDLLSYSKGIYNSALMIIPISALIGSGLVLFLYFQYKKRKGKKV